MLSPTIAAQENLPPGPGQTLILEACVQCHDLRAIVSQRKSESDWRRSVNEMIWRGAPLMPGEAELVSRYLASAFGAGQPIRRATAAIAPHDKLAKFLPPGTGRELVVGACVQCHDLAITVMQRKTPEGWRRSVDQMARLGARLNGSEMQVVADYLARSFGPDDPIPEEILKNPPPVVLPSGTRAAPPAGPRAARPQRRAEIAAAKNSVFFAGGEMPDFMSRKIQNIRGVATPGCPTAGLTNETTVPRTAPCTATLRPGGSRTVRHSTASSGVKFANIPAFHSNGIPASLIDPPGVAPGTTGYGGNDGGFVVKFTNGLTVYLTADTGLAGDMETIVRNFYQANLAVINMGDTATLGPDEAAFAINTLIKPGTVIPSHDNEAATAGGVVNAGTRLERFIQQIKPHTEVKVPLSGVAIQCDGEGHCG